MERAYKLRERIRFGREITEKRYGKKLKCEECGKIYFTNDTTLKKRKQFKLCYKCVNQGKTHSQWKGGRLTREGYILLWMPSHPNCDKYGYMKEHRVIMETKLKRYLTKDEVIHHKNEKKSDNRIENLQLYENDAEHMRYHTQKAWDSLKRRKT